ncbi:MAG TPA: type VI secretion system baseplate subunit TssF [Polyangiaceae bacterium]|jgi:type VI secretion system protein ImpG
MARQPYTDVADLTGTADRFAAALPALAGALAQPTTDAPLERVREGLFYLGAACIDRVRELEAEGQRALADVVAPDLLRPFPSATILELSVEKVGRRVPAGAEVTTKGPRPCRFRTVSELRVGPWGVEQARIEGPHTLRFDLVAEGSSLADAVGGIRPRFFIDGAEGARRLLAHVLAHTKSAELFLEGGGAALPLGAVMPYGTRADQTLTSEPDEPRTGLALLREYFLLPEKFCFFALGGLTAALRGTSARRATVTLTFREPLPVQATATPTIRAHCVPATNLFPASAEPWVFEAGRTSAPVRVAGLSRDEAGAYAVLGASAMARDPLEGRDDAAPTELRPVRRFAAQESPPEFPYAFSAKLVAPPGRAEPEIVVCLTSPRGRPPVLTPHIVSLDLLATNRQRASRLRPGELTEPGARMPPGVRIRNIVPCSAYVPPPTGPELALQVAVRAAVPDGDALFALQSRLLALVPRQGVDPAAVRANVVRVAAIQHLEVAAVIDRAAASRGYEVRLAIDETPFEGLGDVALFVRVLCAAFDAQASIGRFYRCVATATKSGTRIVWPPEAP